MSHVGWPNFSKEEIEAVARVLQSNKVNYWTGDEGRKFEEEFAEFAGTKYAIALANGTVALDLALHGFGIGSRNGGNPDDEVIVTPRSFIASVSCVINAGAKPVFSDVELDTQNISPRTVSPHLTQNTKAIICVHLAGWPCDMDGFRDLVRGQDIKLIEDCAQAHGATYKGRSVGGLGDAAAWSFCQDKIMTTGGEGGMVTCNDETLWRKMWAFKDHGKSYQAVYERKHGNGFRWLHETIGTNWRITEMQAAIGRIQIKRMPQWHTARQNNSKLLTEMLKPYSGPDGFLRLLKLRCSGCAEEGNKSEKCKSAWYKYYAFVLPEKLPLGKTRNDLIEEINRQGLFCMQGSCSEIYNELAFSRTDYIPPKRLENAQLLGDTSLMFTVHPGVVIPPIDLSSWLPN